MDLEPHQLIHEPSVRHVDGHAGAKLAQQRLELGEAVFADQDALDGEPSLPHEHGEHHLALGDERPLPSHQVGLANVAIVRHPGVVQGVDGAQVPP